ncbi:NUDIX hydrolase [Methylotuvimicrobium alcaliphilum]|nr:NUDIX domain-containing protein [Methylotuvimicrobium alcaliphilum]
MAHQVSKSPPIPMIGVSGIAFNCHREVLLIRRNQAPAQGLWSIPGGKMEPGETLVDACRREIEEETGFNNTRVLSLVALVERNIESFHYVIADFLVEILDGENRPPIANSDVSEACWVALDRLDHYELVPGLKDIIENTHRLWQSGTLPGLVDPNGKTGDFICT